MSGDFVIGPNKELQRDLNLGATGATGPIGGEPAPIYLTTCKVSEYGKNPSEDFSEAEPAFAAREREGAAAFRAGLGLDENPFSVFRGRASWAEGWFRAREAGMKASGTVVEEFSVVKSDSSAEQVTRLTTLQAERDAAVLAKNRAFCDIVRKQHALDAALALAAERKDEIAKLQADFAAFKASIVSQNVIRKGPPESLFGVLRRDNKQDIGLITPRSDGMT